MVIDKAGHEVSMQLARPVGYGPIISLPCLALLAAVRTGSAKGTNIVVMTRVHCGSLVGKLRLGGLICENL